MALKETFKVYKHKGCKYNYEWLGRLGRVPKLCPGCKQPLRDGNVVIFELLRKRSGD